MLVEGLVTANANANASANASANANANASASAGTSAGASAYDDMGMISQCMSLCYFATPRIVMLTLRSTPKHHKGEKKEEKRNAS